MVMYSVYGLSLFVGFICSLIIYKFVSTLKSKLISIKELEEFERLT